VRPGDHAKPACMLGFESDDTEKLVPNTKRGEGEKDAKFCPKVEADVSECVRTVPLGDVSQLEGADEHPGPHYPIRVAIVRRAEPSVRAGVVPPLPLRRSTR
jgi:hypothetical protein